jgi:hypothetical protein
MDGLLKSPAVSARMESLFYIYLTYTHIVWYTITKKKERSALLSPQDQLRSFPASVVACKATEHPLVDWTRSKRCDNGDLLCKIPHTPLTYLYEGGLLCGSKGKSFACLEESFRWIKRARKCGYADPLSV